MEFESIYFKDNKNHIILYADMVNLISKRSMSVSYIHVGGFREWMYVKNKQVQLRNNKFVKRPFITFDWQPLVVCRSSKNLR